MEAPEDAAALRRLIGRADALRGPKQDPKLKALIAEVQQLIASGFKPVVFCRYIATAHYIGENLKQRSTGGENLRCRDYWRADI